MTIRKIAFGRPWITEAEREAVLGVLAGDVLTHGPQAQAFEREFAQFVGEEANAVSMSSGAAALHMAYWQLGIGAGDEVIVTAQTHVATAHAVEVVGARAVFVDCRAQDGNIDPDLIEEAITPQTRAIALVHFLGIPCDMRRVLAITERHGLKLIEDCALAVGTRYEGKHVGLFGDAACFSFYPVKHITTGDGGMFVSRHKALAQRVAKARAFGVDRAFSERTIPGMYDVPILGINYRLSDINSAIGRKQLERVSIILERREGNFRALQQGLTGLRNVAILDAQSAVSCNSYYCLSVVLGGELSSRRNDFVRRLNEAGVGTSVYYPHPVPRLGYYKDKYGYDSGRFRQAERISDQSIALPVGPHLDAGDMSYIIERFSAILGEFAT
jgi:dTDP-4-amino-4,6-dideoxygalactose transaminase